MRSNGAHRERVGFVGLGHLGRAMARRAAERGVLDVVWQRTPRPTDDLERLGVRVAASLEDLAEGVDIVSVCVPDEHDLLDVLEGGLCSGLAGRGLVVVHSTVLPDACERLAGVCASHCVRLIDAPVCGGPSFAAEGRLLVSVGGEPDDVVRAQPLLECYGGLVRHVGPVGAGERVKLMMNLLYAANVEIVCEAVAIASALGVPEETFDAFVTALPYQGFVGSALATGAVGADAVEHGRTMLRKDVAYAHRLVDEAAVATTGLLALGDAALDSLRAVAERERRRM